MNKKSVTNRLLGPGVAMLVAFNLLAANPVAAAVTLQQLTNVVELNELGQKYKSAQPDISADGAVVAFSSDADLVHGENPHGVSQIFIMNAGGSGLRQLTNGGHDSNDPALSADGSVAVFASKANLTGENPVGVSQIFVLNTGDGALRQLTHGAKDSTNPDISDDGGMIVFQSAANLVADDNTDGTIEIFAIRSDGEGLLQLTYGLPKIIGHNIPDDASRHPAISGDGTTVAFDSFIDLKEDGSNDDHNNEVFVFDLAGYIARGGDRITFTTQLTDVDIDDENHIRAEEAFEPAISADGQWIVFSGCIDPLGTNPTLADQIFIIKRDGTALRQLTFAGDSNQDAHWPVVSADGSIVVFEAEADLTGENPAQDDGFGGTFHRSQIFAVAADGSGLTQLTNGTNDARRPAVSADGTVAVFEANSDLTGGNADGNREIFSVAFSIPAPQASEPAPGDDDEVTEDEGTGDTGEGSADDNSSGGDTDANATSNEQAGGAAASNTAAPTTSAGAFGLAELLFALAAMLTPVFTQRRRARSI